MLIDINGSIRNKAKIESYARRIMNHFQILNKKAWIEVTFRNKLDGDAAGYAHVESTGHVVIEIAKTCQGEKYSQEEMLITLAHELVHAKQYLTGTLSRDTNRWKGKIYHGYENTPWEKEAYKLESILYNKYW